MVNPRFLAIAAVVLPAVCVAQVSAYFPSDCSPTHAEADHESADAVVVGRVVKIERILETHRLGGQRMLEFSYFATIKVGRVVRGDLRVGDEVKMLMGGYDERKGSGEDNITPVRLRIFGTHSPHLLKITGIYLLYLNRDQPTGKRLETLERSYSSGQTELDDAGRAMWRLFREGHVWKPRSCHHSVHEVILAGATGAVLSVRPGTPRDPYREHPNAPKPLALDEFIGAKTEESRTARERAESAGRDPTPRD